MSHADELYFDLDGDKDATAETDELFFDLDDDKDAGQERVLRAGSHDADYYDLDGEQPSAGDENDDSDDDHDDFLMTTTT